VLRIEQRYKKCTEEEFNVERVTGAMLYDELFYMELVNGLWDSYKAVDKKKNVNINYSEMKGLKGLHQISTVIHAESIGGKTELIEMVSEHAARGIITPTAASEIRKYIKEAYSAEAGQTTVSEVITELDKKMSDAVKYCR
jgi:hypothetical protein